MNDESLEEPSKDIQDASTASPQKALRQKYQDRGFQQMSLEEYLDQKKKKSKKRIQIPQQFKILFYTPLILIFCCGIFLIPYICYQIMTGTPAPAPKNTENKNSSRAGTETGFEISAHRDLFPAYDKPA